MKCWMCGAEPTGLADVTTFGDPEPRYLPTGWPAGDHEHAADPPTAEQLADRGIAAIERKLKIAAE
jgi:hypothetical protein